MSTERPAPTGDLDPTERRAPTRARWRRSIAIVLAVLAVAVAGLTAAAALRPPRIVSAEFDASALVQRAGSRVVLHLDQPVRSARELRITPAAPGATVTVQGAAVTIAFPGLLAYDQRYRIRLGSVEGADTGVAGPLEQRVRTADAPVLSLVRDPGGTDRVVRRDLGGGTVHTVYSAERIQRFAELPAQVAVVTVDRTGVGTLVLAPVAGGPADPVTTEDAGAIDLLRGSGASGLLGFTLTTPLGVEPAVDHVLHVLDPTDGSGVARVVDGLDGAPLSVLDYAWVPGTTSLVAQAMDQSLYLIDPTGTAAPQPLGAHGELRGFEPGTTRLVVADPDGSSVIDLRDGTTTALPLADDGQPAGDYREPPLLLDRTGAYLEVVSSPGADFTSTGWRVVAVDGDGRARTLWTPSTPSSRLGDACLSPNGQYLAVEVIPGDARTDAYPAAPGFPGTETVVVELASGIATRSIPGIAPSWCG